MKREEPHIIGGYPGETISFTAIVNTKTSPDDFCEIDLGPRVILVPFSVLESWYEMARLARKIRENDE